MNYLRILIITLPLIFFNGCEDEKDDEPSYLNLKSFSWLSADGEGNQIWVSWGADGGSPPFGHLLIGQPDWIHLYLDEEYVDRYDSSLVEPRYRFYLRGIEYSYELMD